MDKDLELLKEYMSYWIDRIAPMTLKSQLLIYREKGYIEEGKKSKDIISFKYWKKCIKNE